MIKVTYSSDINSTVGVGGEIVKSASEMRKQASTIFNCEYEEMSPPPGHTGIHLVALGDSDAFPMNRNGDLFPKEACVKYHNTFVEDGHVYQHHVNKDPAKAIGKIVKSAYNPDMHRVELYIWADNEKAHDHLERLEKTGEVSFSMACTVPWDRCSVCNSIRKKAGDSGECEHIKYSLGKIAEDGTQIGTFNDEPRWFDISFVGRPADRIAWNLKVASAMPEGSDVMSSVKRAEVEGYVLPDSIAIESDSARNKLRIMKKLAESYDKVESWMFGGRKPSGDEVVEFEMCKLAGASVDDEALASLREMDPSDAFRALGEAGIVMNAPTFLKYAFGPDYGKVEKYASFVGLETPDVVRDAVKTASCSRFCNESRFDASDSSRVGARSTRGVFSMLMKCSAARGFGSDDPVTSVLEAIASGSVPVFRSKTSEKCAEDGVVPVAKRLAASYAMYKVAALSDAISRCGTVIDENRIITIASAQDFV